MSVRVRFAPSPTGYVHIGSLRTALYDYLYAKKNNGTYLIRVEDTDQTRIVSDAVEEMVNAMNWAGISHTEGPIVENGEMREIGEFGPYVQSHRTEIYQKHVKELIDNGFAYYCFCSKERLDALREKQKENKENPKYDGFCKSLTEEEIQSKIANGESYVIRLKMPENRDIVFEDAIKGKISVNTNDIDDQVLIKQDGLPTYHLAVVVDDHYMKISHVLRGDEWLISTPKQVYTYEAFGWEAPTFVHLPVILNDQKKKLSKRQGDVSVGDFRKKGYLPEALINYVALVGWSPEDGTEIMSLDEMCEKFSLDRVSKSGGVFDVNKLNWVGNQYIKDYDLEKLTRLAKPFLIEYGYSSDEKFTEEFDKMCKIVDVLRERLSYFAELDGYQNLFFGSHVELEDQDAKDMIEMDHVSEMLGVLAEKFDQVEEWTSQNVKKAFKAVQKETGIKGKNLFMPIRVAITGQVHGPDIAVVIELLGKDMAKARVEKMRTI